MIKTKEEAATWKKHLWVNTYEDDPQFCYPNMIEIGGLFGVYLRLKLNPIFEISPTDGSCFKRDTLPFQLMRLRALEELLLIEQKAEKPCPDLIDAIHAEVFQCAEDLKPFMEALKD